MLATVVDPNVTTHNTVQTVRPEFHLRVLQNRSVGAEVWGCACQCLPQVLQGVAAPLHHGRGGSVHNTRSEYAHSWLRLQRGSSGLAPESSSGDSAVNTMSGVQLISSG